MPYEHRTGRLGRRDLLKLAAVAPFAALNIPGRATHRTAAQPSRQIRLSWWGEDEAVGITAWLLETIARFREASGVEVVPTYVPTDEVVKGFRAAAAAGDVPDVQYFWNGMYHMESVWDDRIEPLNGLVAQSVLQRSGATRLSVFEGNQYRAGFYLDAFGVAYNKPLFDRAGLDADHPPRTWTELLAACERLLAAGIIPFGGGASDGYFGDWFFSKALTQNLNSASEAISLFIGDLDWREPRYHEHLNQLVTLLRSGFLNPEINTLKHFEGLAQFDSGRFAMCLYVSPSLSRAQRGLGAGNVGFMVLPVFGSGRMAGIPILDSHGFGIPSAARDKRNAADFIEFMHTKERLQAMWTRSHQIPSDEAFDGRQIDDPLARQVYDQWVAGPHNPYVGDLMPTEFWEDLILRTCQPILDGSIDGEQAADTAQAVARSWRLRNPGMVNNYARWGQSLGL